MGCSSAFIQSGVQPSSGGWWSAGGLGKEFGDNPPSSRQPDDGTSSSPAGSRHASRRWQVVVVEDNEADLYLIREALEASLLDAEIVPLRDGRAAIDYFATFESDSAHPLPDVVLLDLNLPKHNGEEVLERLRSGKRGYAVPVLVVSSSDASRDREALARHGVAGYFRKPSDFAMFMKLGELVKGILS